VIDTAAFAGWFITIVAAILALCGIGYCWSCVRADERQDDEIVERKRFDLIVRWPR